MTLRVILIGIIAVVAIAGTVVYQTIRWAEGPVLSESDHPVNRIVVIPEGATFLQAAALLEREQLIRSRSMFLMLGKSQEADRKIQPGEYEFNGAMLPAEILSKLLTGRVLLYAVTIPEGYTMNQIADVLDGQHITSRTEFLRMASDRAFIKTLGISAETLEGYLFPDTYRFAKATPAKEVIRTMVDQLGRVVTEEWQVRAKEMNLTFHQVLTLASVIEKETGVGGERSHIASVFHNRLKKRIPCKAIRLSSTGCRISTETSIKRPFPSQSLQHLSLGGFAAWPYCKSGADSIRAALYPATSKYLYFVSRNDGTHHFSATLVEHNRAVEKYQKRPFRRGPHSQISVVPGDGNLAYWTGVS